MRRFHSSSQEGTQGKALCRISITLTNRRSRKTIQRVRQATKLMKEQSLCRRSRGLQPLPVTHPGDSLGLSTMSRVFGTLIAIFNHTNLGRHPYKKKSSISTKRHQREGSRPELPCQRNQWMTQQCRSPCMISTSITLPLTHMPQLRGDVSPLHA